MKVNVNNRTVFETVPIKGRNRITIRTLDTKGGNQYISKGILLRPSKRQNVRRVQSQSICRYKVKNGSTKEKKLLTEIVEDEDKIY